MIGDAIKYTAYILKKAQCEFHSLKTSFELCRGRGVFFYLAPLFQTGSV